MLPSSIEAYIQPLKDNPIAWRALSILGVILLSALTYYLSKRLVLRVVRYVIRKTTFKWDDVILDRGVFNKLAYLPPALVFYYFGYLFGTTGAVLQRIVTMYLLLVVALALSDLLSALNDLYDRQEYAKDRPIKGYVQVVKIVMYMFVGVTAIAIALGKSPVAFVSGLGAMTAIIMLVFKDTILSLVASIQITSTDMLRIGDWLAMPSFGADGDVEDIALHTVRVRNWDKTITTIPTHNLISKPFKNWRGMSEVGGRRIKRSLYLDQESVAFIDDADIERLSKISLLSEYLADKKKEIDAYNEERGIDASSAANGRRMTNLGTFRAYLERYLRDHAKVRQDLTLIVRLLDPGPEGLPIQIYCFADDIRWAIYEGIQGDIFDHILAIVPEFGLRVFQNPTGHDFGALAETRSE